MHVVDISHADFEDQIKTVYETLAEIGVSNKPVIMVFNKVDAYTFIKKDDDDLSPVTEENLSLEELKSSWMAKDNHPCIFISAKTRENYDPFKKLLYDHIRKVHSVRYPYNDFLY